MQSLKVPYLMSFLSACKPLMANTSVKSFRPLSDFGSNKMNKPQLLCRSAIVEAKFAASASAPSSPENKSLLNMELQGDDIIQAICKRSHASIGNPAPKFTTDAVVDGQFKKISLSDYEGQYVVLFFYPLDFTFVCPTEIIAFSDRIEEFKKLNASVLAVSTDSKFAHLEWINKSRNLGGLGKLNYPLLADTNHWISRSYGVLKHEDGIAYRGLFIIDASGVVRQITINDLPVGRSVDETLRLIQALQYVEKHGEVCPADWTPGREAIKPSNSKEYFGKIK